MALGIIAALVGPWAVAPLGWIVVAIAVVGIRRARLARASRGGAAARRVRARTRSFISSCRSRTAGTRCRSCRPSGIWLSAVCPAPGRRRPRSGARRLSWHRWSSRCPRAKAYSQYPSPAYAAINDLQQRLSSAPDSVVGAHQRFARVLETTRCRARRFCRRRSCANRPSLPRTGSAAAARLCGTCRILRAAISSWSIR